MPSYEEKATEAGEDYSEESLILLLSFFGAVALGDVLAEAQGAWESALSANLLHQTLEEALQGTGIPIGSLGDLDALAADLRADMAVEAEFMLRDFKASFRKQAGTVLAQAASENWSKAKYTEAMEALAKVAGAQFAGSWAETWLKDGIRRIVNKKQLETFQKDPARRLFPYQVVITKRDGKVRPNHTEMDGFVAATMWSGWSRASPLYGHGCRCVLRAISWEVARAAGMEGPFPYGFDQYAAWSGPDAGYSK